MLTFAVVCCCLLLFAVVCCCCCRCCCCFCCCCWCWRCCWPSICNTRPPTHMQRTSGKHFGHSGRHHVTLCAAVMGSKLLNRVGFGTGLCAAETLTTAMLGQRCSRARNVAKTNEQFALPTQRGNNVHGFATPLTKSNQYRRRPHTTTIV